MSTTKNDGGPAFPFPATQETDSNAPMGMSLRDWLAGNERLAEWDDPEAVPSKAMCAALAGPMPAHGWGAKTDEEWIAILTWEAKWRAAIRYIRADAMLEARKS